MDFLRAFIRTPYGGVLSAKPLAKGETIMKSAIAALALTLTVFSARAALADSMGTPHPSASPSHMMSHSSNKMGHSMMKASPKPSPSHAASMMSHGSMTSHGSMMKASPKPLMSP
jgi:hypothetical protein